jgi:hypothetical protein
MGDSEILTTGVGGYCGRLIKTVDQCGELDRLTLNQ